VTGGWRKLHNEGLHNLYSSQGIIRMIKSMGYEIGMACSMNGGKDGKPEGRRSVQRSRRWCVDNIKMDLERGMMGGMAWIDLA
jgi:hypothetical protein